MQRGVGCRGAPPQEAHDEPGARVEVRKGTHSVRLARLHEAPFTDRLVAKFGLPVEGWRGDGERRRLPSMRSEGSTP